MDVRPTASYRPKHVSPDDPRAGVVEATCDEVIINAFFPTVVVHRGVECARFDNQNCRQSMILLHNVPLIANR